MKTDPLQTQGHADEKTQTRITYMLYCIFNGLMLCGAKICEIIILFTKIWCHNNMIWFAL